MVGGLGSEVNISLLSSEGNNLYYGKSTEAREGQDGTKENTYTVYMIL